MADECRMGSDNTMQCQADALDIESENIAAAPEDAAESNTAVTAAAEGQTADDEVDELSQQMAESLHGSERGDAVSCSQASSNSMFSGAPHGAGDRDGSPDRGPRRQSPHQQARSGISAACYQFPDTVHSARRFPWGPELCKRYFNSHLVAPDEEYQFLSAHAKALECVPPGDPALEKDPSYGLSWTFVDILDGGMSEYLRKAIFFFRTIEALSRQYKWNGFVVGTNNLSENLSPKFMAGVQEKDIVGVVSSAVIDREPVDSMGGDGGVDLDRLLDLGNQASGGSVHRALPLLKIFVGITGANFQCRRTGEQFQSKQALFGTVRVDWLLNVNFMELMMGRILATPRINTGQFLKINQRNLQLLDMLEGLLLKQIYYMNSGATTGGELPRHSWENPNARYGANTLCNPFVAPFKMVNELRRRHGEVQGVEIIGFPHINWTGNPDVPGPLKDFLRFVSAYTAHVVDWSSLIGAFCRSNVTERPSTQQGRRRNTQEADDDEERTTEHTFKIIPGWPMGGAEGVRNGYHCRWHAEMCPIVMRYRPLKPVDTEEDVGCFMINMGEPPELVTCLMRSFQFSDKNDATDFETLNQFSMGALRIPWNPFNVREHFSSANTPLNTQLAVSGCKLELYKKIVKYIQVSVADGTMSPHCAVRTLRKYFEMSRCMMDSMIENGKFLSDMMKQIQKVKTALYQPTASLDDPRETMPLLYVELMAFQTETLKGVPLECTVNHVDFVRHVLFQMLIGINNNGQMLNSLNESNKLALVLSVVSYCLGKVNSTTDIIGRAMEISPCAGSAREMVMVGNLRKSVTRTDNPNGAGKDMVFEKYNEDCKNLMNWIGMFTPPMFSIQLLTGFTELSVQLSCCIQTADGEVVSTPDPALALRPCAITEFRTSSKEEGDKAKNTLIKYVFPRGGTADTSGLTTRDKNGTRQLVNKERVIDLRVVGYCSNQKASDQEPIKTLHAVNHVVAPGATVVTQQTQSVLFNDVMLNKFEGRSIQLSAQWEKISGMFAATQVLTMGFLGPMNDCGFFKAEISSGTCAALEVLFFYVKYYYESLFNELCVKSRLIRLKKVYESRESAFTMWTTMTKSLMMFDTFEAALTNAAMEFQFDSIALTNCGSMLYTMINRCLSWVPVFISRCFVIEIGMPVVPIEILIELLTIDRIPSPGESELRQWYDRICAWGNDCLLHNRFCPNPSGGGYCEYITSDGAADGSVEREALLRVASKSNAWRDMNDTNSAHKMLATSIWNMYGMQLDLACAVSRDSLVPGVSDMLRSFLVDFGKMLGIDVFNAPRHFEFFGLSQQMQFSPLSAEPSASGTKAPYAIQAVWMRGDKEAASIGLGVHFTQLLLLGSFIGESIEDRIHPQIVSDLSQSLVKYMLLRFPSAMTPCSLVEMGAFNCYTGGLRPINLKDTRMTRPRHILRPQSEQFATHGEVPLGANSGIFASEDYLHCSALDGWRVLLGLSCITEVPATAVVSYYLEGGKSYAVYNQVTGCLGTLFIGAQGADFEAETSPGASDRAGKTMLPLSLETDLAFEGFILLPCIRRSGACIRTQPEEGGECGIGCLVQPGEDEPHCDNFCMADLKYRVLRRPETVEPVGTLYVMKNLLPLGQLLLLKCEAQSARPLLSCLLFPLGASALPKHGLRGYLNTPDVAEPVDGKVYITVCVLDGQSFVPMSVCVDPWELCFESPQRRKIDYIMHKNHRARAAAC